MKRALSEFQGGVTDRRGVLFAPEESMAEIPSEGDAKLPPRAPVPASRPPSKERSMKKNAPLKQDAPRALFIMAQDEGMRLRDICSRLGLETVEADCCNKARGLLLSQPQIELVFTGLSLPDGNWCDVLRFVVNREIDVTVLLGCTTADERLWSEAMWRGIYDLIVEPYDEGEVRRIVEGALRHSLPLHCEESWKVAGGAR